ncbi:hypothetical protein [Nonomuraea indica]|uniref:hypothetical protein n=1 Tax=Nonomuraea indica TaxID=1581193 RepID=UPI000C7A2483|nr:hypothetical protein [Nonomuraea indica]
MARRPVKPTSHGVNTTRPSSTSTAEVSTHMESGRRHATAVAPSPASTSTAPASGHPGRSDTAGARPESTAAPA